MRERIHPTLWWVAVYDWDRDTASNTMLCHCDKLVWLRAIRQIEALWFIEKKEESDSDDEWIDGAYIEYIKAFDKDTFVQLWHKDNFKQAILSHLPKK